MDVWFYGFWFIYALFALTIYKAYLSKLIYRLRFGNRYVHFHIIDTGEYGDKVFTEGKNSVLGVERAFVKDKVKNGTIFYESKNAEPLEIKRDLKAYKYYCDTKNFDTISRNDVLETLMVLNAKQVILLLIGLSILISIVSLVANWYFTNSMHNDLNTNFELIMNQTRNPVIIHD